MKVVYPCCNIIWGHLTSFTQMFYQCTVLCNIITYEIPHISSLENYLQIEVKELGVY